MVIAGVAVFQLLSYCLIMGMTPGPNNLMLAASGMNFGLRRTLPHILGVLIGFVTLVFACGVGIGTLYSEVPALQIVLRWLGSALLLYLAWRIGSASRMEHPQDARPLSFMEASLFQFANPKAWIFSITAATSFLSTNSDRLPGALVLAAAAACITVLSTLSWTLFGTVLARLIHSERRQRVVNVIFALALCAIVPLILFP